MLRVLTKPTFTLTVLNNVAPVTSTKASGEDLVATTNALTKEVYEIVIRRGEPT